MPGRRTRSVTDRETRLAQAALRLLGKQEWDRITLASVARSARLPLSEVLAIVPSKAALPGIVLRMLVDETARRHEADPETGGPRERVFDATMTFFDVQNLHASALKNLYRALQYDPPTLLATRKDILRFAGELLALAEADIGLSPRVQTALFAAILVRAVFAWRDDGDEMGKTMTQLDGDLRRVQRFMWPKPGRTVGPSAPPKARSDRNRSPVGKRKDSR